MIGFKIMDFDKGEVKTLFHDLRGSKIVPRFTWLDAETTDMRGFDRMVRDSPDSKWYRPGWHVLETREQAISHLTRFKNLDHKVIVKVTTEGKRWKKEHSPAEGLWLCERMRIDGIVVFSQSVVNRFLKGEVV